MHAVTIGADRFIGGLPGELFFKQFDGCAVEICHIGIEHVGGDPVFVHNA